MVAIDDIKTDEILSRIPKSALLEPNTTALKEIIYQSTSILKFLFIQINMLNNFMHKGGNKLKSKSNWSKLIVSIMHELSIPNSKWQPYLDLFPNYDYLDLPMFWEKYLLISLI